MEVDTSLALEIEFFRATSFLKTHKAVLQGKLSPFSRMIGKLYRQPRKVSVNCTDVGEMR